MANRAHHRRQRRELAAHPRAAPLATDPVNADALVRRRAERLAWQRIAFIAHAIVFASVCALLLLVAGPLVAAIVGMAWSIGLLTHGFFAVVAPVLRKRWVEGEVGRRVSVSVTHERRANEGRHARALEQLSASVAHEIRSPITAAKSLVQQIAEDPSAPTNAEFATLAVTELDRVERSVSHLLRYAREEPLSLRETDLEEVLQSALETLRDRITPSGVQIETQHESDGLVQADADKLRRVLINLVGNALDALSESGFPDPRIRITSGASLSGSELWLKVSDNGPGIEPERLEHIFDPFHTSKERGTGLGLAITRKLVEAHGGSLEVESQIGQGTTFALTLPRYAVASAQ